MLAKVEPIISVQSVNPSRETADHMRVNSSQDLGFKTLPTNRLNIDIYICVIAFTPALGLDVI